MGFDFGGDSRQKSTYVAPPVGNNANHDIAAAVDERRLPKGRRLRGVVGGQPQVTSGPIASKSPQEIRRQFGVKEVAVDGGPQSCRRRGSGIGNTRHDHVVPPWPVWTAVPNEMRQRIDDRIIPTGVLVSIDLWMKACTRTSQKQVRGGQAIATHGVPLDQKCDDRPLSGRGRHARRQEYATVE